MRIHHNLTDEHRVISVPKEDLYESAVNMVTYYTKGDSTIAKTAMDLFVDKSLPPSSEPFKRQCVLVVSDVIFNKDIYRLAMQAKQRDSPIYLYTFRYNKPTKFTDRYAFQGKCWGQVCVPFSIPNKQQTREQPEMGTQAECVFRNTVTPNVMHSEPTADNSRNCHRQAHAKWTEFLVDEKRIQT